MKTNNNFDSFSKKRVSYILATKNHAKFLEKALLKYRKLIKPTDELIVIDGASNDNTTRIVKKYADLVDIYISEPDINPTHAFNKGLLLARGKYVKNLNDDDTIYPNAMEKAIGILEKNQDVDLLICGGVKQRGKLFATICLPPGTNYGQDIKDVFKYGALGDGFIIRRTLFAKVGVLPVNEVSGSSFVVECIHKGANVKFCRIKLYLHKIYNHSAIIGRKSEVHADNLKLIKQYFPISFYWRFRLTEIIQQYKSLAIMAYYLSLPSQFIKAARDKGLIYTLVIIANHLRGKKYKSENKKYIWDGGFS